MAKPTQMHMAITIYCLPKTIVQTMPVPTDIMEHFAANQNYNFLFWFYEAINLWCM